MSELATIAVSELKENETYSNLVPEMNELEYKDFLESIKKDGVRQPIHVLLDKTILDGRHRVRACKDVGITHIQALVHNLNDDEAIEFVRDTAIERRNITKVQRVDIILRSEDLIKSIEKEARKRKVKGKKATSGPAGPKVDGNKRTSQIIADMAGSSKTTVNRLKKIKKENPKDYEKVVSGEKSATSAYNELESVSVVNKPKNKPEPPTAGGNFFLHHFPLVYR